MPIVIVSDVTALPEEIDLTRQHHFQEIFRSSWRDVYGQSPLLEKNEKSLMVVWDGELAGWVHFQKGIYNLRFRNFYVHPKFRGRQIARLMLQNLSAIGTTHHQQLLQTGAKPSDIGLMFLQSLIYPDGEQDGEVFAFGKFLKKMGFSSYHYNKGGVTPEEAAAIACYEKMSIAQTLRTFRLRIVDDGVTLKASTQAELLRMSAEARAVVLNGLSWKIGHYAKSGRVSYRYDLCPICKFVGSSEQNSDNCKKCPIHETCFEPFREIGRFKEDYEISGAYFQAVLNFLLAHRENK